MPDLLIWKRFAKGSDTELGGRGNISFYKICRSESGQRFVLSGYLHGATATDWMFDTPEGAKRFAEEDFKDWMRRTGLKPQWSADA